MKPARVLLAIACVCLSCACSAASPAGPEVLPAERPLYDGGTNHGSGG